MASTASASLSVIPSITGSQRMMWTGVAAVVALIGGGFYAAARPPITASRIRLCGSNGGPPITASRIRLCGSKGGPPITASRIRLKDGRLLAYAEFGVLKEEAKFKIIFCHGFSGTRLDGLSASPELMEELGVYIASFDRPGYAESDPDPVRSPKSAASDIEELADALELGPKFYLISYSLGGHAAWASLKYIPERLAGAALLAPVINYRWPGFPKDLSRELYNKQDLGDQWSLRLAYYAPWLLHWWIKQSWLPSSTVIKGTTYLPNRLDAESRAYVVSTGAFLERRKLATQQGIQESYLRDLAVMFGKWEFDPMDLPQVNFPVHLWQGDEDGLVPVELQRYICSRLSWIQYHELPSTGHYMSRVPGLVDRILKTLLLDSSTEPDIHDSQI